MQVTVGTLAAAQRRGLERLRRRAVGRVSQRAHMVPLSARGYAVPDLATIFACGEDVVRQRLHRYSERGEAGLEELPRSGRPPRDRLAAAVIDAQLRQPPTCSGHVQTGWTVRLLTAFLATRFRLVLSAGRVRAYVRAYVRATGWRWARPRLAPATHAPAGQRKVDLAAPLKLALIAKALASAATGLYLDECDLALLPVVRAMWMKGPRVRVPTPGQNAKRAFFGALDARTGALHYATQPKKLVVHFVAFLEQLARAYPAGEVVLVLDNVITHDARVVRAWLARPAPARVRVLWPPKYSAHEHAHEHNPIERVWGLLKDAVAANRLAGSMDALVAEAHRFFARATFPASYPRPDALPMAA